jgi:hypothetical protein
MPPLLRTMLWVLHIILMSPMICGSIVEETTALIHIRTTLEGRYSVPELNHRRWVLESELGDFFSIS